MLGLRQAGTWNPFLQCLHLDTPLLQQQNIKKLYWTKNECVHEQLGQILDPKDTKRSKNPTATFKETGTKNRVPEAKEEYYACPLHTPQFKGLANHVNHPYSHPM